MLMFKNGNKLTVQQIPLGLCRELKEENFSAMKHVNNLFHLKFRFWRVGLYSNHMDIETETYID